MRRKLIFIVSVLFIAFSFTACDVLGDCQVCRYESYDSNSGTTTYSEETEYCGSDLLTMKATPSSTNGSVTTRVKCY